jgi:hypothetical protein
MPTRKRTAILVVYCLVLAIAVTRGWAADTTANAPVSVGKAGTDGGDNTLLGILAPILTNPATHAAQQGCKPDQLYSRHDVVGDPEACFKGGYDIHAGMINGGAGAPAL